VLGASDNNKPNDSKCPLLRNPEQNTPAVLWLWKKRVGGAGKREWGKGLGEKITVY
jgi:hypothetical protein